MKHSISYYDEDRKQVAFCVFCSCENVVELLDGICPGHYVKIDNKPVDKLNTKV